VAIGVLAALGAAIAFGIGALLQAIAARREQATSGVDLRLLIRLLRHPVYVFAVLLYLAGFGLHLVAIRTAPLFLAQALISSSVAVTAVLAARVLRAPFGRVEQVSVAVVCAGLFVLAVAAESHGDVTTTIGQRTVLLVATVALVLLGWLVGRLRGEAAATALSLLSGCGYAIVAVSARLLPSLDLATLVSDPATYALVVSGVGAFLLYSTALQRAGVLVTTSALVVTQTAVPAVVGVALLGDTVASGWGAAAAAAFVVALGGVLVLARRDSLAELESTAAGASARV
jgi:drug/metabolite transporter (DMT)-like permease